jgi:hypothetical protein
LPALKPAVVPLSKTLRESAIIGIVIIAFVHARVRSPTGDAVVKSCPVPFMETLAEPSPEGVTRIGQVGSCKYPEAKIIGFHFQLGRPQREQPKDRRNENEAFFHEVQFLIPKWLGRGVALLLFGPSIQFRFADPGSSWLCVTKAARSNTWVNTRGRTGHLGLRLFPDGRLDGVTIGKHHRVQTNRLSVPRDCKRNRQKRVGRVSNSTATASKSSS